MCFFFSRQYNSVLISQKPQPTSCYNTVNQTLFKNSCKCMWLDLIRIHSIHESWSNWTTCTHRTIYTSSFYPPTKSHEIIIKILITTSLFTFNMQHIFAFITPWAAHAQLQTTSVLMPVHTHPWAIFRPLTCSSKIFNAASWSPWRTYKTPSYKTRKTII